MDAGLAEADDRVRTPGDDRTATGVPWAGVQVATMPKAAKVASTAASNAVISPKHNPRWRMITGSLVRNGHLISEPPALPTCFSSIVSRSRGRIWGKLVGVRHAHRQAVAPGTGSTKGTSGGICM
jgi:hypothetical protein